MTSEACIRADLGWETEALRLRGRLVSCARRILRDREDAEDVADEALARLVRARNAGEEIRGLSSWLYTTTLRLAIQQARAWTRKARWQPDVARRVRRAGEDPSGEAMRTERREAVWRHLLELPDRQQMVIILKDMEGLPYREVAEFLDIEEGTARAHAHAARRKLSEKLKNVVGGEP